MKSVFYSLSKPKNIQLFILGENYVNELQETQLIVDVDLIFQFLEPSLFPAYMLEETSNELLTPVIVFNEFLLETQAVE